MTTGRITLEVSEVARLRADAARASELSGKVARYEAALRAIVETWDDLEGQEGVTDTMALKAVVAEIDRAREALR